MRVGEKGRRKRGDWSVRGERSEERSKRCLGERTREMGEDWRDERGGGQELGERQGRSEARVLKHPLPISH